MLVISRKRNESIIVDHDIEITIVDIIRIGRGDKVRLGIDCPVDKPIHRKEVWEAIQREKEARKKEQ